MEGERERQTKRDIEEEKFKHTERKTGRWRELVAINRLSDR